MPTISVEDYLKAMYHLEGPDRDRVKTKALAEHLSVTLPSATSMLKSLSADDLVEYAPYRGALLSESGMRIALRVIRNHRLIEAFLVRTLGYGWDEVHPEAERLEHAVSDDLVDRIDRFLSHPRFDPHGDPIPTADGRIERRQTRSLLEVGPRRTARVVRVLDQSAEVLRYLETLELMPGADVEVLDVMPFDGPVVVRRGQTEVPLSRTLATCVRVQVDETDPI